MKRGDFVIIALAILLALTPLLLRPARGAAPRAIVRKDGEIAAELPLDEDAVTACFRKTAGAARGCKLEIAQRDVYRIGKDVGKVRRYVELARRALEG